MFPDVVAVSPQLDHRLCLAFANGECRCFDMTLYLDYPVFRRPRTPGFLPSCPSSAWARGRETAASGTNDTKWSLCVPHSHAELRNE
jgi:hypothetical protein